MDLEVVLLIGAAVVGIVVGILHLVGYVPPRYRSMLKSIQADTAKAISEAIEGLLTRLLPENGSESVLDPNVALAPLTARLDALPQAIGAELTKALAAAQEDALKAMEAVQGVIPPEITGSMGGIVTQDRRKAQELNDAIGRGLLGPYGTILEQVFPPLYEYLVANPDQVVQALKMPVVQDLIKHGAALASKLTGQIRSGGESNPFMGDLRP